MNEMPTRGQRPRPSFVPPGNFQPPQLMQQAPPPTEEETWTAEEMNLLSMIHRRDRKILHLQEENRRLEMNVLQQGQHLREINAQVEDLKKQHEELKRDEQCCCAPEPIVNVTSAPKRPFFGTKVDEVIEEGQE